MRAPGARGSPPIGVLVAFAVCATAFVAIGIFLGAVMPTAQAAQAVGLVLFFVSEMTAGVGPPREVLPQTMQQVALALPLTHVPTALQDSWIGRGVNLADLGIVAAARTAGCPRDVHTQPVCAAAIRATQRGGPRRTPGSGLRPPI